MRSLLLIKQPTCWNFTESCCCYFCCCYLRVSRAIFHFYQCTLCARMHCGAQWNKWCWNWWRRNWWCWDWKTWDIEKFWDFEMVRKTIVIFSAWNEYFASAGYCVRQWTLRAGHSQFVPVIRIWYTIEIWKPVGHCDGQKTNPVGLTWNRAGQLPMIGRYFMHWYDSRIV